MTLEDATRTVVEVLETNSVPYMVVGSLASIQYGIVRSTKDVAFVVELQGQSVMAICRQLGSEFRLDPQTTFETVTGTVRHVVNIPSILFRVEFFRLSSDPHDQERFRRRTQSYFPQLDREAWTITAEDVIVTKLRWAQCAARGKDREDVRDVITIQGSQLDWDYIHRWCDEHGTRELLNEIRSQIPPDLLT